MHSITFTCETITPMFLAGADGQTPELRAPSIKGAMRFWWRAMNGHLGLEEMRKREGEIFGSAERGRSRVLLKVKSINELQIKKYARLPHRRDTGKYPSPAPSFEVGQTFEVELRLLHETEHIKFPQLKSLFELVALLGGFGKRVRRGMGSFVIRKMRMNKEDYQPYNIPNIQEAHQLLSQLSRHFDVQKDIIQNIFTGQMEGYPFIRQIQLGKEYYESAEDLIVHIGTVSSELKDENPRRYEASMGHASGGKRFASPIYVSISQNEQGYFPIITTLNTIADYHRRKDVDLFVQRNYKEQLL